MLWVASLMLYASWGLAAFLLLVLVLTLHSSLTHETLHSIPVPSERAGTLLGLIQPGLAVPYLRFKRLHLAHHRDANLTDPYDDPESNYLDPQVWHRLPAWRRAVLRVNNTLAGRMLIGPLIGQWAFLSSDGAAIVKGDRVVLMDWLLHLPGVVLVLWLVSLSPMPIYVYFAACYAALCMLKIRTFLEHRAHVRASARTVIVEDRGPLALLFLNNNFHVVHHMHPQVPWYKLPALYRSQQAHYQGRNGGYVYRSYGTVFRQYLWRAKDPVPHPLWQSPQE
jgi:fatty acid desaturase